MQRSSVRAEASARAALLISQRTAATLRVMPRLPKRPLLASFKVFPKGRWFHFRVFVWKRRRDMLVALHKGHIADIAHCEAICVSNTVYACSNGRSRMTGLIGQIHFHRHSFMMGVITHEAGHAALAYCRRARVSPVEPGDGVKASRGEETFCWVLGNVARQIVLKAERQWKFPGGEAVGIEYA